MTDQHTLGPWRVGTVGLLNSGARAVVYEDGRICTVDSHLENVSARDKWEAICAQREANARLIAASPELLAFAESLVSAMDAPPKLRKALIEARLQNARQVIAKARGVTG